MALSTDKKGKVYIVGAGCGDFDLITLRGERCIKNCTALVYDSLVDPRLCQLADKNARKICVGKRFGMHGERQESINRLLVELAQSGETVVRLKGGDPFVFGRGGEEAIALQKAGIDFEIVPGVTSAVAVPELAGIPVTHRNLSRGFHVITGTTAQNARPAEMKAYAEAGGTLVLLMGLNALGEIAERLIAYGKSPETPAAVVSNGAYADNVCVRGTLADICAKVIKYHVKPPAVTVVGECAALDLSSPENKTLRGVSIAVTGTQKFADKLSSRLALLGATVKRESPLRVIEYYDNPRFDSALKSLAGGDCVVLTSMNGAEIFFARLSRLRMDLRALSGVKFAVIGSGTAAVLEKHGIFADLMPEEFTSRQLGKLLCKSLEKSERAVIFRAENGSPDLTDELEARGVIYEDIKTYAVQGGTCAGNVDADCITFASASGVRAFFDGRGTISPNTTAVCIGKITASALENYGVCSHKIAEASSADGIVDVILQIKQKD